MSLYRKNQWKEFRDEIIELDGNKCTKCGRHKNEVILQVHHKKYIKGRKPWEYPTEDCQTLCKGCHAAEHGLIKPQFGWEYIGDEDLEDLIGTCENCGSSVRYIFVIYHEKWGTIEVGTYCCDKLTDSTFASNLIESQTSFKGRKERFISSKRWKIRNGCFTIKQSHFEIEIREYCTFFYLKIHDLESTTPYESLNDAKSKAFDVIENGELIKFLQSKKIDFIGKKR
ncbi:HNH endonuclease [Arsenicibacter rosenii]|uniref:Uncharacterized protein n=1 Tax=Arsenicibacter rosenii TaxID=1750698 RepID=A0A1S2VDM3_9BACT|nr:HNH endonuclease signature motif containing protein [Arsenicibacter rosenii]OIN56385.1 hypothetical protein BLX24_24725 [Arsenicibacter rosenii]